MSSKQEENELKRNTQWGSVTENNSFGTRNYMELLDKLGVAI